MGKSTDPTRAERKAKKRALEAAIPNLPGDDNVEAADEVSTKPEKKQKDKSKKRKRGGDEEENEVVEEELNSKKSKKEKKEKKRKTEESDAMEEVLAADAEKPGEKEKKSKKDNKASKDDSEVQEEAAQLVDADTVMGDVDTPKKSKKERKAERRAREVAANEAAKKDDTIEPVPETNGQSATKEKKKTAAEEKKSKKNNRNREKKRKVASADGDVADEEEKDKKPARFIVFVGNLPFTATKESVTSHFASVHPQSVRLLTHKDDPSKTKGFAFVEFAGFDHMKTCLKLMHHSTFDDGKSAARKINVELTAGGGGNTKERKSKIETKNAKLNEERIRRIHEEEKAKFAKAIEGGKAGGVDESAIHPSRRGRVPAMS